MTRLLSFLFIAMCICSFASMVFAWSDDIEGMLISTPRGEDVKTDFDSLYEQVEGPADTLLENTETTIEWE